MDSKDNSLRISFSEDGIFLIFEVHEVKPATMAIINLGKLIKIGSVYDLLNESDTFVTEIKAEPLNQANKVLESLDYISNITESDGTFKVRIANKDLKKLTRELVKADIDVSAIIPRTSLEDYFLSLTGDDI